MFFFWRMRELRGGVGGGGVGGASERREYGMEEGGGEGMSDF